MPLNADVTILNKSKKNKKQKQHTMTKWDLSQVCKAGLVLESYYNSLQCIVTVSALDGHLYF